MIHLKIIGSNEHDEKHGQKVLGTKVVNAETGEQLANVESVSWQADIERGLTVATIRIHGVAIPSE